MCAILRRHRLYLGTYEIQVRMYNLQIEFYLFGLLFPKLILLIVAVIS